MAQLDIHIEPAGSAGPSIYYGTAAPTSGTYEYADQCWNTAPTAAGTALWICTAAGSPGTWNAVALEA